jgi:hypothetical protein
VKLRLLFGAVILGLGSLVVFQLEGAARLAAWEILITMDVLAMSWRAWPERPGRVGGLIGGDHLGIESRPLRLLASLELEVGAAIDPRLSGDRVLRRRLFDLVRHRAAHQGGEVETGEMRRLLGDAAWRHLFEDDGPLDMERVEHLVERIEAI